MSRGSERNEFSQEPYLNQQISNLIKEFIPLCILFSMLQTVNGGQSINLN